MTLKQLSDGGADGTVLGQSATDKIGFYGTTPVVRSGLTALTSTVVFSEAKTGMWAFGSSTVAKAYTTRVRQVVAMLKSIGLAT